MATFAYIADSKNPPVPEGATVQLVGELTKGKYIDMVPAMSTPEKTVYACKIAVEPGYKYTFCFKIGNEILNDRDRKSVV